MSLHFYCLCYVLRGRRWLSSIITLFHVFESCSHPAWVAEMIAGTEGVNFVLSNATRRCHAENPRIARSWCVTFRPYIWSIPIPSFLRSSMAASHKTTSEIVRLATDKVQRSEIPRVLSTIFDAKDYTKSIQQLQEKDLRMWVDRLDKVCWL